MDGGFEWTIFEIFEITMVVALLLTIGGALLFVPKVETIKTASYATELKHTANLISNTDIIVEISHNDFIINQNKNELTTIHKDNKKVEITKEFYGEEIEVKEIGENTYCISRDCSNSEEQQESTQENLEEDNKT